MHNDRHGYHSNDYHIFNNYYLDNCREMFNFAAVEEKETI